MDDRLPGVVDRARVRAAFDRYVATYDPADPKVRLKIDHTYRVAALCDRIARAAGLPGPDRDLAWLCGMLHDIGRFEQTRRYGTFSDARSVDHAALGVEILFDEGRLADFVDLPGPGSADLPGPAASRADPPGLSAPEADLPAAVRTVVGTHSAFRLPEGIDLRTRALCDVVRDADKIDILKAFRESDMVSVLDVSRRDLLESPLSQPVVDAFYGHRTVRRDERAWPADVVMSYPCFLFELAYTESLRIAASQGDVFALFEVPFAVPATRWAVRAMGAHLRAWVDGALRGDAAGGR